MTNVISIIISSIAGVFETVFSGLQNVVSASSEALGNAQ